MNMNLIKSILLFIAKLPPNLLIFVFKLILKSVGITLVSFGQFTSIITGLISLLLDGFAICFAIIAVLSAVGLFMPQDIQLTLALVGCGVFFGVCRMFVDSIPELIASAGEWVATLADYIDFL